MPRELAGRRILVVEDSPVVADLIGYFLDELGCTVVGPAGNMASARELAGTQDIDAALVDIRIRGEKAFPICDLLAERRIPFILTSGYADWPVPERWQGAPRLPKPYKLDDLERELRRLLHA